jgi:beta-1,4-mannosyltransferase
MSNSLRILAWPAFKAKGSPYNALLYNNMQTLGATVEEFTAWRVLSTRYDVVHLHWPEYCLNGRGPLASFFWTCALFGAMSWVRLRGGKVFWTFTIWRVMGSNIPRPSAAFGEPSRHSWTVISA